LHQLEKRLRRAEDELAAGDVLRDNLRADKEKFLHFLEHLSRTLGMDTISADVGLDGTTNAVLVRAEQLVRSEAAALAERKTQVYSLQRKLKVMKDQLDSKDVHMELLRKKTVSLEERLSSKTDLEREKDAESVRSRKLMKLAEKYKRELNETHAELRDLRARLLHSTEVQGRNIKLEQDVERLEVELHRLEQIRQQQASSLGSLQETVSTATHEHSRKHDQASNTISALTSELRTTKQALEDVTKREQQLVDLRNVVARMLGLSIDTLAVPDYEVIARLEQLILANQTNAATAFALDTAFAEVGDAFRSGYHDATHRLMVTGGRPSSIPGIPGVHHRRKVETVLH
jgi:chromosome segregation ATPase